MNLNRLILCLLWSHCSIAGNQRADWDVKQYIAAQREKDNTQKSILSQIHKILVEVSSKNENDEEAMGMEDDQPEAHKWTRIRSR
jgi:hypothetical protein